MSTVTHHRRDLRIEAAFLPDDVAELAELRGRIVDLIRSGQCDEVSPGSADTTADSIIGWLVSKLTGADSLSSTTRSRYRRILGQVSPTGGERGSVTVRSLLVALGVATAAAAVAGSPTITAAAIAASPIIYEDDVMSCRAA